MTRSEKVDSDIRRLSMLAIANLASCSDNHDDFISLSVIPMLVSFSNSSDVELRNFAALAVAELSRNSDMMQIITDEGGLEAVLYLARSDDKSVQRQVLPALTTLSFLDCNKVPICTNGALPPIIDFLRSDGRRSDEEHQLACCAIANLVETASNMALVVNHGCVTLLVDAAALADDLAATLSPSLDDSPPLPNFDVFVFFFGFVPLLPPLRFSLPPMNAPVDFAIVKRQNST
jgi:hypothetical protein